MRHAPAALNYSNLKNKAYIIKEEYEDTLFNKTNIP